MTSFLPTAREIVGQPDNVQGLTARLQADLDLSAGPVFSDHDGFVEMRTSRGVRLLDRNEANYHYRRYGEVIDGLLRSKDPEDHPRAWKVEDLRLDLDHAMRVAWGSCEAPAEITLRVVTPSGGWVVGPESGPEAA